MWGDLRPANKRYPNQFNIAITIVGGNKKRLYLLL